MNIFKKLLISSTIISFASPVISQVNANQKLAPSRDKKNLEREILIAENQFQQENNTLKITVTGSRTPRPVDTFPGSIEVINMEDLENTTGLNLRELTDSIQGLTTQFSKTHGYRGTPNTGDNLNIRGLDKDRVLFQIDGIRLPSYNYGSQDGALTRTSNENASTVYTMNPGAYINFDTLKTVEIIKGPASALYGSDALGGLISFESLEAEDLLGDAEDFNIEIPSNYNSSNNGYSGSIKMATKLSENTSALFIYTNENSDELDVKTESKYLDNEDNLGNNYFVNLTQKVGDFGKANIIYENIDRSSEVTSKADNLALMTDINTKNDATETFQSIFTDTTTSRERISLNYEYDNPNNKNFIDSFKLKIYNQYSRVDDDSKVTWTYDLPALIIFGTQTRPRTVTVYNDVNDYYMKNDLFGFDIQAQSNLKMFDSDHLITYGADYSTSDTTRIRPKTRTKTVTTHINAFVIDTADPVADNSTKKDTPDSDITRTGFYVQDEFSKGKFDFIAGLRYDNYDLDAKADSTFLSSGDTSTDGSGTNLTNAYAADLNESNWSPKFAATYNINQNSSFYGSYSRGFRAPAYYEVNSSFYNRKSLYITESNPSLKPETSDSYEIGIRRFTNNSRIKLAAFYNRYNDFIEQLKIQDPDNITSSSVDTYKSVNINSVETQGIEFSSNYFFNEDKSGINISSFITYQEGNNLTDNVPLTTINPFEAKIALGYKTNNEKWDTKLINTFVGKPKTKSNETNFVPDAYSVTDLITSYIPSEKYSYSLGIYNLFDTTYYNYQDVKSKSSSLANITRYSQPGTFVKAGFKIRF